LEEAEFIPVERVDGGEGSQGIVADVAQELADMGPAESNPNTGSDFPILTIFHERESVPSWPGAAPGLL